MKRIIHLAFPCLFLLFSLAESGCAQSCKYTVEIPVVIFFDITDLEHRTLLKKHIEEEYGHIQLYLNKSQAFSECHRTAVKVAPINDKGENRFHTTTSDQVDSDMTPTQINRTVKAPFYQKLKGNIIKVLTMMKDDSSDLKQTRIYEPLCLLLRGYRNTGQVLDVIIYSDLQENSQVSFYQKGKAIPVDKTLKDLETSCNCVLPADLSFLRLHLISFRTDDNDQLIGPARNFWISVFTKRNATVNTGTGLQDGFFAPVKK